MLMLWNDRPRELWLGERQLKCTLTLPNAPSITPIRTLKPHQAMVARGTWPKAKYQQCHPSSPTRSALNIAAMGEQLMLIFGSFYLNVSLKVDGEELMSAVYVCVCVSVSVCSVCVRVCKCVCLQVVSRHYCGYCYKMSFEFHSCLWNFTRCLLRTEHDARCVHLEYTKGLMKHKSKQADTHFTINDHGPKHKTLKKKNSETSLS